MQLNKSEEELRCESDKVRRAMTTAEKVKEEKSDLSSELSGRDSEITLLKANEKRLVRDLAGTNSNSLWKSVFALRMEGYMLGPLPPSTSLGMQCLTF